MSDGGQERSMCRAVLDIGTNSVKVLVGRVAGSTVEPVFERGEQTRLGQGLFNTGRLEADAIARTAEAARRLIDRATPHRPESIRAIATAAAREASNAGDLIDAIRDACSLELEVISGEREADLAFQGVASDPALARQELLVTDVGGGSTEFILGSAGRREFSRSFPLGSVRLHESVRPPDDPTPGDLARCRQEVSGFLAHQVLPALPPEILRGARNGTLTWVAVGGTAVILGRVANASDAFDRAQIEETRMTAASLTEITERLWSLPLAMRREVPGLPAERADIMLTGAAIHEAILRGVSLRSMRPSTRGLRFGVLLNAPR